MRVPTKLLGILAVIIIFATATGCDSGNGGNSQALTEIDFAQNPSLQADPDNQVIVDFLESPDSDTPQYDTGPVGIDEIPITYPQTETHTICWTDVNSEAMDYMELRDSEDNTILTVEANGDCVEEVIEAGDYVMELHHDGSTGDPLPIFIIPNPDQNQQAMKTDGFFNGIKVVIGKILRGIQNTISDDARAQTVQQNINTLLSTNSCVECDLYGANLSGANLRGANLRGAYLVAANFTRAVVSGVDFTDAYLPRADFRHADLTGSKLTGSKRGCRCFVDGPQFFGATWCNGCKCQFPSTGVCNGCPPVDKVCTRISSVPVVRNVTVP